MNALSESNVQVNEAPELLVEIEKEYLMKELSAEDRAPLFKMTAKNGLKINVFSDKLIFSSRGRNTEIPRHKVVGITVKKSLAETLRLENTLVLDLECGRVVTLGRIPVSKVDALKGAILAHQ